MNIVICGKFKYGDDEIIVKQDVATTQKTQSSTTSIYSAKQGGAGVSGRSRAR